MAGTADIEYMERALSLAYRGNGNTSPNPMVGAVIVKGGQIIGEGYHTRAGKNHAEIEALKVAGENAKGATIYVTLEPCCHTGKTGPCTEALIEAKVKRVVYAMKDPDPRVNGKGARILRKAGIEVTSGILRDKARTLNEKFLGFQANGRPFVTVKTAQTLDGRIATSTGDSQWVSGPESLKFAHQLRAENDAVMVGMGTVRADNPSLTVRRVKGRDPYRIVVSSSLDFPKESNLLTNDDGRTIIAATVDALAGFKPANNSNGTAYWAVKAARDGGVDLKSLMKMAADNGIQSILVEGGGNLVTSLLKAGLVDKYIAIIAPKVVGKGISAVDELEIRKLSKAIEFSNPSFAGSGKDMIFTGYPKRRNG